MQIAAVFTRSATGWQALSWSQDATILFRVGESINQHAELIVSGTAGKRNNVLQQVHTAVDNDFSADDVGGEIQHRRGHPFRCDDGSTN